MSKRRNGFGADKARRTPATKFRLMPKLRSFVKRSPELAREFINSWNLVKLLIAAEVIINYLIINRVSYTEIDWSTYMSQVRQIFNSSNFNFDYSQIEGPTGPLVYPAGHTYIFYFLKELTDDGSSIRMAQYVYLCIYIAQLVLVYKIYSHKRVQKVPPYMFILMCATSHRIHSIYVLRLFNDPIAVFVAYASFYALLRKRYTTSALLYSLAISVKMNILLFAPAYALIFYEDIGFIKSAKNAGIALGLQVVLALPYLLTNPLAYLSRSFNFGRVFLHEWTVNWRFLDEKTFTSPDFFKMLLAIHLGVLFVMFWSRWLNAITLKRLNLNVRRDDVILTLFIANLVGVACSRSLHYQFYVWYYHSLPMLLWATRYNTPVRLLIMGCIEWSWNQFPSTNFSSAILHVSHLLLVLGLITRHFRLFPKKAKV